MINRRSLFGLACAPLLLMSGCGFEPLNEVSPVGSASPVRILIMPIADRPGQILHNALRDQLNPDGQPYDYTHRMVVTLRETISALSGIPADETTRRILRVGATVQILPRQGTQVLLQQNFESSFRYSGFSTRFVTSEPLIQARQKALSLLADDIARYVRVQALS